VEAYSKMLRLVSALNRGNKDGRVLEMNPGRFLILNIYSIRKRADNWERSLIRIPALVNGLSENRTLEYFLDALNIIRTGLELSLNLGIAKILYYYGTSLVFIL
jgi:hypothetical protein